MSPIDTVTGAIHASLTSSMTSNRRLMILSVVLLQLVNTVNSGAVLQLQMLRFENSNSRDWDDSCCDFACWSSCDHIFTFSLDLSTGDDDCKHYYYWTQRSGTFDNQNTNIFSSDMKGVANPIITQFITPSWPGAVKFKVYIEDDDAPWTGNDPVDGIVQRLQLIPAASQSTASWGSIEMQGVRPSHKTRLVMNYLLYCQPNYYSSDCSVYCLASDSNDGHYTCDPSTGNIVCRPGWQDPSSRCTRSTDNCVGNQCQNGATCANGATSYTCNCAAGFTGVRCEVNINECASNPCLNLGTCTDLVAGYRCTCPAAFVGPTCSQPYCQVNTNPCRNGGTCFGAGLCQCPARYAGWDCSIDRCDVVTCKNGGRCTADGTCSCPEGFVGATCEIDRCSLTLCLNGGTCRKSGCACPAGFTGRYCETNINDCIGNPCDHDGTCHDRVNGFTCDCLPDWTGPSCSLPVQPSNSTSSAGNYSSYIRDQPSSNVNPVDAWFYASFCIIFLLLVVIIILSVSLCRQRRAASKLPEKSVREPAQRMESVENTYAVDAVVIKGIEGCSSTDKDDDDPKYQSIGKPSSPPPRYSTVGDPIGPGLQVCNEVGDPVGLGLEDYNQIDEVFLST